MIWILGCEGLLGRELARLFQESGIPFFGTGREIDVADKGALASFTEGRRIGWIVNCAAYTDVDKAEDEPERARSVNAAGAENAAVTAERAGARLIHLSTDYVFGGERRKPYKETDPVHPLGVYGKSKAEGEELAAKACSRYFVVRSAWLYGRYGHNFVHAVLRRLAAEKSAEVVDDQIGTPTWTRDLAVFIHRLIAGGAAAYGTYHFSGGGETSRFGFAERIRKEAEAAGFLEAGTTVRPVASGAHPTKARRPVYSVLDCTKAVRTFGLEPAGWERSLREYMLTVKKREIFQ